MSRSEARDLKQLQSVRALFEHVGQKLNARISVRLWDGSLIPLGEQVEPDLCVSISGPGVIGSLLRRPTVDNLMRHYARGHIDFHGADIHTVLKTARTRGSRKRGRSMSKSLILRSLLPFVFTPAESSHLEHSFEGDEWGRNRRQEDNKGFIQFHYDLSNEFYELFLDPEMVYSCAYFTDWNNTLEQAQLDKLDMICRKLRLQPGERFLDIGCGWGALVCHAARHYGVEAHGITLSQRQLEYAQAKVNRLGLSDQVTLEIRDYAELTGKFDKISSIGMVEHVGINNMPKYMSTVAALLPDRGMFLNHGLTRRAKKSQRHFRRKNSAKRLLARYIFPGGELDHLGHMIECMEAYGFEVHDVEGWRDHYAHTCKLWSQRLQDHRDEAIRHVGQERYRIWILYLAAVSLAIEDGGACIFQTVATRNASKGVTTMPPTRAHLYENRHSGPAARRAA